MKNKKSSQYYNILLNTKIQIILDIRLPGLVKKLELNGCTEDFAQTFLKLPSSFCAGMSHGDLLFGK